MSTATGERRRRETFITAWILGGILHFNGPLHVFLSCLFICLEVCSTSTSPGKTLIAETEKAAYQSSGIGQVLMEGQRVGKGLILCLGA